MSQGKKSNFTLNTGADLAFALVVLISFFTIFSSSPVTNPILILIIIFLGVAYITVGIYGFSYAQKANSTNIKMLYFAIQLFLGGLIVYFGKGAGINALVLLPLVAHSAMLLDQDRILIVNAGIILGYFISVLAYSHSVLEVWKGAPFFFAGQVVILIFTQMAVTELKARVNLEKLADELSLANKRLSDYANRVQELTITQERNRMAREIHDGLGHYLTVLNMQIKASIAIIDKDKKKAISLLDDAIHLSSEALIDVRSSVFALRQDPNEIKPLFERIERIAEAASSKEQRIQSTLIGEPRIVSPQVDLTLYRAAQEMANNVLKHSKAKNIEFTLDYSNQNTIRFTCIDDGIGSESLEQGFGLIGLKERVRLLNGNVEINTSPGKGFKINIIVLSENVH